MASLFFYYGRLSSAQLDRWQAPMQLPINGIPERDQSQWI